MSGLKQTIKNSPVGYGIKVILYTFRLPKYIAFLEEKVRQGEAIMTTLQEDAAKVRDQGDKQTTKIHSLDEKVSDIKHSLFVSNLSAQATVSTAAPVNNTMADDPANDRFYKLFEDRFRGDEATIKKRLQEYVPYFDSLAPAVKKLPILDIGCGRGEFLDLAQDMGFKAIGIDMNKTMVERAVSLGYTAVEADAISYIVDQKPETVSAITGFHLVEHIPFPILLNLFNECYRVIKTGGFVLFETPNAQNLTVGACNFYNDPSHLKPIPPAVLAFALEISGFEPEIIYLHPDKQDIHHEDPIVQDMMTKLYGPQDYAVLARKR